MGTASALCTLLLENFWTEVGLKVLFKELSKFEKIVASFCWMSFPF
jgi:hypothetical protein